VRSSNRPAVGQGRAVLAEHVHQNGDVRAVGMGALGGLLEPLRVAEEDDVPRGAGGGQGVGQ
jgi:hypothetical protein